MTRSIVTVRLAAGVLSAALLLSACADQPGSIVNVPLPPQVQRVSGFERAAEEEHRQLVAAFGGEYSSPRAEALLKEIADRLVPATERPNERYRVTLLNSPAVNAFALPTGRLYVTRGLLALANDTSEIAAVLAHEIAHVTLRHAAERSELELRSALVSRVVSDVLNDPVAGAMVRDVARVDIARFSRAQELEADQISVKTLARSGYDPYGAARFLTSLNRQLELRTASAGGAGAAVGALAQNAAAEMLSSHPSTPQRIAEAKVAARRIGAPGIAGEGRERYLAAIDGVTFGDDPSDGVIRGSRFVHARLGVAFEAPDGFALENSSRAVHGSTADGERRLMFDAVETREGQGLDDVLTSTFNEAVEPGTVSSLNVNGLSAATASSRGRDWIFRMAAVRIGGTTYRLIMAFRTHSSGAVSERLFRETLSSIRVVPDTEAALIQPLRVRLVTAAAGDTVETLAARMQVTDRRLERFLVLNGLERGATLRVGERYKIVGD